MQFDPSDGLHNRFWHLLSSRQCRDTEIQDPQSLEEKHSVEDCGMLGRVDPGQDTVAAVAEKSGHWVSSLTLDVRLDAHEGSCKKL